MNLRLTRQLLQEGLTKTEAGDLAARHRQQRNLHRTGIVRLAEAGAITAQIAAVSGHRVDYCQQIIDTYLPKHTEVALGAIREFENHGATDLSNVVKIITGGKHRAAA